MSEQETVELSIVSPVYMGERAVHELVREMKRFAIEAVGEGNYEIVLVDDGSPDDSWSRIEETCAANPCVRGIKLSRNFGQHHAITAGFDASRGRYVIIMDCDLQDEPKHIPDLYAKAQEGFDIVYTRKRTRAHSALRNLLGKAFHRLQDWAMAPRGWKSHAAVGAYTLLSRRVVDALGQMGDTHRQYLGLLRWIGFKHAIIEIDHRQRPYGKSSYTLQRLIKEGIISITSQSDRVLYVSIGLGFLFVTVSVLVAMYLVVGYFTHGFKEGWTSIIVLHLLSTGMILLSLGVMGVYVGKIFEQSKGRPLYFVQKKLNMND